MKMFSTILDPKYTSFLQIIFLVSTLAHDFEGLCNYKEENIHKEKKVR